MMENICKPNLDKFREAVEQEIDFIGQLYVEFEQLMKYPDIYDTMDNLRSLVSLFRDFVDRIYHLIRSGDDFQIWNVLPEKASLDTQATDRSEAFGRLFSSSTLMVLNPFLQLYRDYSTIYPDRIVREKVVDLAEAFWKASELVARDLRDVQRFLLASN